MSLPTIVLIPGACYSPQHYTPLVDSLEACKFEVVAERLPSVGSEKPRQQSVAKDADFIQNRLLRRIIDAGKEILLLMHSYGGCLGSHAAKELSKAERQAAGKKGGIVGLVFMCAFVAAEGDSLLSKLPGQQYPPWIIQNHETAQVTTDNPKNVFYNLVDDATAQKAISLLLPHAEPALSSPSGPPAWPDDVYNGKRAYIQTKQDNTVPFVAQDAMVKYSGVQWDVIKLNAGHSPFLSHAEEVAAFVVTKAKDYVE